MVRVFGDLYQFLSLFVPVKVIVGLAVVGGLLALPAWMETVREKQIQGQVRRMVRAEQTERARLRDETLALAGTRPGRLTRVVEASRKYDQRDLLESALARLDEVDRARAERLRTLGDPPKRRVRDPLEIVVRVEGLLQSGMHGVAIEAIEAGLRDFPDDPELLALRARAERPVEPA